MENGKYNIYVEAYDKAKNIRKTDSIEFEVKQVIKFNKIFSFGSSSMAVDTNGNLWGWGYNNEYQLDNKLTYNKTNSYSQRYLTVPTVLNMLENNNRVNFIACRSGGSASLKVDSNGKIWSSRT